MAPTKILYRHRKDALQAARGGGKYWISTCDAADMNIVQDEVLRDAFGETQCYRSVDGSVYAWWED